MEEQVKEGGGAQTPALAEKVEKLEQLYAGLTAARSVGRWIRLVVVLVILVVVLGQAYNGFMTIKSGFSDMEQGDFAATVAPGLKLLANAAQKEVMLMLEELKPVYIEELQKQAEERLPELQAAVMKEAKDLSMTVAEEGEKKLKAKLEQLSEDEKDNIKKQFGLEDDKKVEVALVNIQNALRGAFVDVLWDRLGKAEETLLRVHRKAVKFLPSDRQAGFQRRVEDGWDALSKQIKSAHEQMRKDPAGTVEKALKDAAGAKE